MLRNIGQPEELADKLLDKFAESLVLGTGRYVPTEEEMAVEHFRKRRELWLAGEDPRGAFDYVPKEYDAVMGGLDE